MATERLKYQLESLRLQIRNNFSSNFSTNISEDVKIEFETEPDAVELSIREINDINPSVFKIEVEGRKPDDDFERQVPKKKREKLKPNQDLCRCCLSEGKFISMDRRPTMAEGTLSYAEMLRSALGLTLARIDEAPCICSTCVVRLTQALAFRQQVVTVERAFLAQESLDLPLKPEIYTYAPEDNGETSMQFPSLSNTYYKVDSPKFVLIDNKEPAESDVEESWDLDDDIPLNTIPLAKQKRNTVASVPAKRETPDTLKRRPTCNGASDEKVKCEMCTAVFKKSCIYGHILRKHLTCYFCKRKFDDLHSISIKSRVAKQKEIREHISKEHPFNCRTCAVIFDTRSKRQAHFDNGVRRCFTCNKHFPQEDIDKHKLEAHGLTTQCGICDMVFKTQQKVKKHQRRVHMRQRDSPCPQCEYVAFDKSCLQRHMLVHGIGADKKQQCKHCGKKFVRTGTLRFHERIHTGDKRSVCKLCGEAFVQRASLKYHLQKRHPGLW